MVDDLKRWAGDGWRVALVFEGHGPAQRAAEVLRDAGLGRPRWSTRSTTPPAPGELLVTCGALDHGFVDEASPARACITGTDITGGRGASTRDMRKMPSRRRNTIDPLELRAGDFVVHEQHGIGRYVELVQRTVNGADREYLVIEYAASASAASPATGSSSRPTSSTSSPATSAASTRPCTRWAARDWQKAKARARKAVREIAAQLIQLYAARQAVQGPRVRAGHPVAARAGGRLPLHGDARPARRDRRGQAATWSRPVPMDRLICGDVGYGKTEIAVRAAFKAVQDGKQVAVLVPTTLLAQQHFNTFSERMSQFPVEIRQLSRFQTPKEAERDPRDGRRRHGRHRHRHPPAAADVDPVQAARPGHRRRGAALRRRAQGAPQGAARLRSTC